MAIDSAKGDGVKMPHHIQTRGSIIYNELLPYADQLKIAAHSMFVTIKENLGKAVMMREIRPGVGIWIEKLYRYISSFGLNFSKNDHLVLIHLVYELITIPMLEPILLGRFCQTLTLLLKKKELISPEDLTLPWKPLYDLCRKIFFSRQGTPGMYKYSSSLRTTIESVVHAAKFYFPIGATGEIMETLRPMLCPFDSNLMVNTITIAEWFLPLCLHPEMSKYGYKMWFTELLDLWEMCNNDLVWEQEMMWLMARLARQNIGYINWEKYMPVMFTRILRSLNLPVSYKQSVVSNIKTHNLDSAAMALWIVSVLGGNSTARLHFEKLMNMIACYYNPTNYGMWSPKLADFLQELSLYFVQRVNFERYKKLTWETKVNTGYSLTEEDIDKFVEILMPIVFQAIFSKMLPQACEAIHHLATLRPKLIVEQVIHRFDTFEHVLTEPHKLIATMDCLVAIARPMLEGKWFGYPEGPTHVVRLMFALLPAIDANDFTKSITACVLYTTFFSMVPIINSSEALLYLNNMTEEEREICAETGRFEDFVIQFIHQCFQLVTNSVLHSRNDRITYKRSKLENLTERSLYAVFKALLEQTSPQIFKTALKLLVDFVQGNVFEIYVAGQNLAVVCQAYAQVNPEETLTKLLPWLCRGIIERTQAPDIEMDALLDNAVLYHLLLLSKIVNCPGILPHIPLLMEVLDHTLHLKCYKGYTLASKVLLNAMLGLSATVPLEYRSITQPPDMHVKDYLPIKDWGKPGDLVDLQIKWCFPGKNEIDAMNLLLWKYLPHEIGRINAYVNGSSVMSRDELGCSLSIITGILGCNTILPLWDEPPVKLVDSETSICSFEVPTGHREDHVRMPDGSNVRKSLVEVLDKLQQKMLEDSEDDTKALFMLISIWECLLMSTSSPFSGSVDMAYKKYQSMKNCQKNVLLGKKKHVRSILIQRVKFQHQFLIRSSTMNLTETHIQIIRNIFFLCTSRYSQVRIKAQDKLYMALENFVDSYLVLAPDLLECLKLDSNTFHEKFKGALHLVVGMKHSALLTVPDWGFLSKLWPAIVESKPSEKLSVIRLLDGIAQHVPKYLPTIGIRLQIPDSCVMVAENLWRHMPISDSFISSEDVTYGLSLQQQRNSLNEENYNVILDSLVHAMEQPDLHWRHKRIGAVFLRCLVHPDVHYTRRTVQFFLGALISDSIFIRKCAVRGVLYALIQQKRTHKKIVWDQYASMDCNNDLSINPGPRPDNEWLLYDSKAVPLSALEWDEPRYMHKLYHGYYSWPRELQMYAPSSQQPMLDRCSRDGIPPEEEPVEAFFSDPRNVHSLMEYHALEERKGSDKFDAYRFLMFKNLFRNHGDAYLPHFLPHLERMAGCRQESLQRAAAELIAGVIRGSKHWPYAKVSSMWASLSPIIETAFQNMMEETVSDWGICIASALEGRDPNRHHWLLEILMDNPLRNEPSYISCGRLYSLQGALTQQEWRVPELYRRLLHYIKPFLAHSYQNIRDRLGSLLCNIFGVDIVVPGGNRSTTTRISEFVDTILPQLGILSDITPGLVSNISLVMQIEGPATCSGCVATTVTELTSLHEKEREGAIRLLKTVCRWLLTSASRAPFGAHPDFYKFFVLLCQMENCEMDDELSKLCKNTLVALCQSKIHPTHVPVIIAAIETASKSSSWSTRISCLGFLQVFAYRNTHILLMDEHWICQVIEIVLRLLEDEWLEVRSKAGEALSGLFYVGVIDNPKELLDGFKAKASSGCKKRRRADSASITRRHSGVIGLCAYIASHPFDMPSLAAEVLLFLGNHQHDPEPIPATINLCIRDFRRTHRENLQFEPLSEEHQDILNDTGVPPSYVT